MKPLLLNKKSTSFQQSFSINYHRRAQFLNVWHYHPELELIFVKKSTGTCFAGDKIFSFKEGELILLGSNLPHTIKNDAVLMDENDSLEAEAIVIHFPGTFLEEITLHIPEFKVLDKLLKKTNRGIHFFNKKDREEIEVILKKILEGDDFSRVLNFLSLLKLLADEKDFQFIASQGYINSLGHSNNRIDKVYEFVMNNFDNPSINLNQIAGVAHMNKSAFCRYFKKVTQKTFSRYLNEIRIGYACKILLEEEKKSISEISHLSGFNNISNFNRQFKLIVGMSPRKYIRLHW